MSTQAVFLKSAVNLLSISKRAEVLNLFNACRQHVISLENMYTIDLLFILKTPVIVSFIFLSVGKIKHRYASKILFILNKFFFGFVGW